LAGLRLKQRFERLQWIVDWQDLWSYDENYLNRIPEIYKKRLLAAEREVFKFADVNVTTNEFAKSILINHYQVPPNKVVAIHHHFSHDDLEPMAQSDKISGTAVSGKAIKVGYLGNLFKPPKVPGEKVVQAFCRLSDKLGNIELHVFGDTTRRRRKSAKDNSCEAVIFHERTGHKKSLANIARCDFLLLVLGDLPNCRAIMHQKLPHYLMLGKPILAIVPEDSAVARIIHETSSGFVIPTETEWDLPLVRIFNDYARNEILFRPDREAIEAYNGKNISKKWQKLFCS
jgi:glycosyltransferase involved in cell wall biosynthesis